MNGARKLSHLVHGLERLDEDHVRSELGEGARPRERFLETMGRASMGARHDHQVGPLALPVHGGPDAAERLDPLDVYSPYTFSPSTRALSSSKELGRRGTHRIALAASFDDQLVPKTSSSER